MRLLLVRHVNQLGWARARYNARVIFRMVLLLSLFLLAFSSAACDAPATALVNAPKPGLVGKARYRTDDNSTNEYLTFTSNASEAEIRSSFERYCRQRGLTPSSKPPISFIWYESQKEALGISLSADATIKGIVDVSYCYAGP